MHFLFRKLGQKISSTLPNLDPAITDSPGQHYTYKVRKGCWEPYNYSLAEIASERVTTLESMNEFYQHIAAGGTYQFVVSGHVLSANDDL